MSAIRAIAAEKLRTFSSPLFLGLVLTPYVVITALLALAMGGTVPENVAELPLTTQEQALREMFAQLSYAWGAGIPLMVLTAILSANALAREQERGTVSILLSKPVRRRDVVLGNFFAIVVFTFLAMVAGLLMLAVALYVVYGLSPQTLSGLFALFPGTFAYALFTAVFVGALGTLAGEVSKSRLVTLLAVLLVPISFFGFLFVRMLTGGAGVYEEYHLYLLDTGYHLGNAFVTVHDLAGTEFTPETMSALATPTGVYDSMDSGVDPLLGELSVSVPLSGYVPPIASVVGLLLLAVLMLGGAVVHFERKDIA